jgi:hypothetical protein
VADRGVQSKIVRLVETVQCFASVPWETPFLLRALCLNHDSRIIALTQAAAERRLRTDTAMLLTRSTAMTHSTQLWKTSDSRA